MNHRLQWDIFCKVIDNFGDIGVCWRLAADLARRGHSVRLWADDASALAWMARRGPRLAEWRVPWFLVLTLGCLPAYLQYPAFYDNYLTGYRVLPLLLFADILRETRWDWPAGMK